MNKKTLIKIAGAVLCLVIAYLWFGGIFRSDIYADNALYSFRAFGWFDRVGGGQTSPVDWFGHVPLWANLSFHDGPPLVFLIQHISFLIFGGGIFALRLPFILAGFASTILIFLFTRKITNDKTATVAALVFAVNSYALWAALSGYLEGIQQVFIVATFFLLYYFVYKDTSKKFLYLFSACLALSLISKYTSIFLFLPTAILFFAQRKNIFKSITVKQRIVALIIFIAVLSPVILYNLKVFETRGHFDAALSSMVGMHPEDFKIVSKREVSLDVIGNFNSILSIFWHNNSYFISISALLAMLWLGIKISRKRGTDFEKYVLITLLSALLMLSMIGSDTRYVSIVTPLLAVLIGLGFHEAFAFVRSRESKKLLYGYLVVVAAIIGFEAFYSYNTHVAAKPLGQVGLTHSSSRLVAYGFNELDSYLRENAFEKIPHRPSKKPSKFSFKKEDVEGKSLVVYDDRMNWFAQMWYFQRYIAYYRLPVFSSTHFASDDGLINLDLLAKASGNDVYFVYPVDDAVLDDVRKNHAQIGQFGPVFSKRLDYFEVPFDIVKSREGKDVFKVYKIPASLFEKK